MNRYTKTNIKDNDNSSKINTKLCKSIFNECSDGRFICHYNNCNFAHSLEELTPLPCKFMNSCRMYRCEFIHPEESKEFWVDRQGLNYLRDRISETEKVEKDKTRTKLCNSVVNEEKTCFNKECSYAHSLEGKDGIRFIDCNFGIKCKKPRHNCKYKHEDETKEQYFTKNKIYQYKDVVVERTSKLNITIREQKDGVVKSLEKVLKEQDCSNIIITVEILPDDKTEEPIKTKTDDKREEPIKTKTDDKTEEPIKTKTVLVKLKSKRNLLRL